LSINQLADAICGRLTEAESGEGLSKVRSWLNLWPAKSGT